MTKPKVLVGCEFSQTITKEFRKRGIEAYSCDLLPTDGNSDWHIQGDIFKLIGTRWDLGIFHPPCTYLANSGVSWLYNKDGSKNAERWNNMNDGARFFHQLLNFNCKRLLIENPIPHKYALEMMGRKYDQIIQPWMFGHMESKATCIWLKNLPKLVPTNDVKEEMMKLPKKERQRLHYLPPSKDRWKIRSTTYQGIAEAIAEQYGGLL